MSNCEYCGYHPYEYVDVGIGSIAVAVNCCELGFYAYQKDMSHRQILAAMRKAMGTKGESCSKCKNTKARRAGCVRCGGLGIVFPEQEVTP